MQKILQSIGGHSYAHPWRVILTWVLILGVTIFGAATFMEQPKTTVTIPGTEADTGITRMKELFPDAGSGAARVVVSAPDDKKLTDYSPTITQLMTAISQTTGVEQAVSPFVNPNGLSKDGQTGIIQVQLTESSGEVGEDTINGIDQAIKEARQSGLTVESGGDTVGHVPGNLMGLGEVIGIVIALGVLLATFGSLVSAGMPVGLALLGVGISLTGLFSLGQLVEINSTTPALAAMLGLAVGIDYSLFIISKYRSYLFDGASYEEAASRSIRTAGSAVVFAALTVVIALAALMVVRIPFMTIMGLSGAATVAIAAALTITLLPALFRLLGNKIVSKKNRQHIASAQERGFHPQHEAKTSSPGYAWSSLITKSPLATIVLAVIVVGIVAWPVQSINLGLPSDQYANPHSTERKAYDMIAEDFGVGYNAPLMVIVEGLAPVSETEKTAAKQNLQAKLENEFNQQAAAKQAELQTRLQNTTSPGETAVLQKEFRQLAAEGEFKKAEASQQIELKTTELGKRLHLQSVGDEIAKIDNVEKVMVAMASDDGSYGVLQVLPKTAPQDQATIDLINILRTTSAQDSWSTNPIIVNATGSTAMQIDINNKLAEALPVYLMVVVGLSIVLLVLAFRSVLIPLKATLGYILSVLAMFGALTAVFQWGWFGLTDAPGPIVSFIPIIASGILFGLAMDYEFFLVSGMKEEYARTKDAKKSVINGFGHGSKVVTAAAIIMISVFTGFITNENNTVRALGFALAVGVLVDAFLVRMTIVPAVMVILGKAAWWLPAWLNKILPDVAIDEE